MKILMVSHYALPHRGGIEIIIEKLSTSLADQGHQIKIISSQPDLPFQQFTHNREFVGVPAFDPLKQFGVHYPLFSPSLWPVLRQSVRWADIVHAQGMLYQNSLLALWLARSWKRPAVLTEHAGFVPYSRRMFNAVQQMGVSTLGRLSLSLSDTVIVPDTIVKEILVDSIKVPSEKIIQIPLGVDTNVFHPVTLEEKQQLRHELGWDERPRILFIGNFVARKRVELLIDAISDKFDIVMCGEGKPPSPLARGVSTYSPRGHDLLAKLYQAADVFVIPSSVETFSIASYESMACGLPVVMTEDLQHLTIKQSGLVTFTKPNPPALQQAIHELLADDDRRRRIGLASAEWVERNFSWQLSVKKHLDLYENLLATDRSSSKP